MNPRPSGYEPDELPDCSTPRGAAAIIGEGVAGGGAAAQGGGGAPAAAPWPGGDRLSRP